MHKVILDTDPGVDDAMAIAYALCHPQIELMALTTVFGNVNITKATRNAQYILDVFGATNVDVAVGAAVPVTQQPLGHAEFVHGEDGIGNCYPSNPEPLNATAKHAQLHKLSAADYIIAKAHEFPGEITLIAVGPLSNVAIALKKEPQLPTLLKQLIVMGGNVDEPGNVTPLAEANFYNDPHAADQLLAHEWPMVIVGLDVTHKIMLTDTHLAKLRDNAKKTGDLIWRTSRFYVDFYTQKGAAMGLSEPCCAMHDAAAIAYLVVPEAFELVHGGCRVVPDGMAAGQLAMDRKGYDYAKPDWDDRPDAMACMQVDAEQVRASFLSSIIDHCIQ